MTKKEYEELAALVSRYNEAYEAAEPLVSDYEYDLLMQRLKAAEAEHPEYAAADSPTQRAGAPVKREAGVTVEHDVPMLSIEDVFTKDDVLKFVREVRARYPEAAFSVEQKIDGLSMSLRYEDGELVLAETRGDGYVGEDVTLNARVIPDVVQHLKTHKGALELRGEVYMTEADFDRTNRAQEQMTLVFEKPGYTTGLEVLYAGTRQAETHAETVLEWPQGVEDRYYVYADGRLQTIATDSSRAVR